MNDKTYHQINATVINNARREYFVNGNMDKKELEYHVIGIGGSAIILSFDGCRAPTSIELKFSQVLNDKHLQIWGVAPMKRNMIRSLLRRSRDTRSTLIKQLIEVCYGDHHQVYHLVVLDQHLNSMDKGYRIT